MDKVQSGNGEAFGLRPLRMMFWAGMVVLAAGVGYYVYVGSKAFTRELVDFQPTPDSSNAMRQRNAQAMLEVAEAVHWTLSDGSRQRAFYRPSDNGALIIYAHGSPGAGAGFHPYVAALGELGYGALAIDLPGYGASEGSRAWDETFLESIRRAVDFAESQGIDPQRIGGFGYSMGTYLISRAAADEPRLSALVLLAGYTNLHDQLLRQFHWRLPGVGYFAVAAAYLSGVPVMQMDTEASLAQLRQRPVLVVSGTEDYAIPISMAQQLADAAPQARLWVIDGAGHGDFEDKYGPGYYRVLDEFWQGALLGRPLQAMTDRATTRTH